MGAFGVPLGCLWGAFWEPFGELLVTLGALWATFGRLGRALVKLWLTWEPFGCPFWENLEFLHDLDLKCALGLLKGTLWIVLLVFGRIRLAF